MAGPDEILAVLRSIDTSLKVLVAAQPKPGPTLAPDSDLDGQYGDPVVDAKDPRDWKGDSQKGRHFSECPPLYLDLMASRLDYFADKAEAEGKLTNSGKPVAPFNRRDAARARGWAARLRGGWQRPGFTQDSTAAIFGPETIPPPPAAPAAAQPAQMPLVPPVPGGFSDEEIPF